MSVTLIIILATVGFSIWGFQTPSVFDKYAFYPFRVAKNKEYIRFFSSSMLHVSWMHLLFNMMTLYFFGAVVEQSFNYYTPGYGALIMLGMYVSGMVVSEIGTLQKYQNDRSYSSVGASGAVSAILFSSIWFMPTNQILVMFIPMPGFVFGALYLLYTAWAAKNDYTGHINHDAHFYGSVWGILVTLVLAPESLAAFFDQMARFSF
jgi:membrane associated rhomboid family serine protease